MTTRGDALFELVSADADALFCSDGPARILVNLLSRQSTAADTEPVCRGTAR